VDSTAQALPFIPRGGASLVVLTSRHRLHINAPELVLGPLSHDDSVDLLGGAGITGAAEMAALCSCFPLALRIATINLIEYPNHSLTAYAAELRQRGPLNLLETVDGQISVRGTFDRSRERQSVAAQRMFRLLAATREFTAATAGAVAEVPVGEAELLLSSLADANLLVRLRDGRFTYLDLVRHYAVDHAA
jgi:hypothetical protein